MSKIKSLLFFIIFLPSTVFNMNINLDTQTYDENGLMIIFENKTVKYTMETYIWKPSEKTIYENYAIIYEEQQSPKSIQFTPSGRMFIVVTQDTIQVIETKTGKLITTINSGSLAPHYSIAINKTETFIAFSGPSINEKFSIKIFNIQTGEKITEIYASHKKDIVLLQFSYDTNQLLSIDEDGVFQIWSLNDKNKVPIDYYCLPYHHWVKTAFFKSSINSQNFWLTWTGELFVWTEKLKFSQKVGTLKNSYFDKNALAYEPQKNLFAFCELGYIKILNINNLEIISEIKHDYREEKALFLKFNNVDFNNIYITSIDHDGLLKYWKFNNEKPLKTFDTKIISTNRDICFSADKKIAIVASILPNEIDMQFIPLK